MKEDNKNKKNSLSKCVDKKKSKKDNRIAFYGFILACSIVFGILGLILSIIGLIISKKYENSRKKYAIGGIIISTISIILITVLSFIIYNKIYISVPDFSEMQSSEITKWFKDNNISYNIEYSFSNKYYNGNYMFQNVKPGIKVKRDTKFVITYSKGPEEVCIKFMVDDKEYDKRCVKQGNTVSKPEDPVKDGYTFSKWSSYSTYSSETYDFSLPLKRDKTVYAHFNKIIVPKNDESKNQSYSGRYESIYNYYSNRLRNECPNISLSECAEIVTEGVSEMATYMWSAKGTDGQYKTYEEWGSKLYDVYFESAM